MNPEWKIRRLLLCNLLVALLFSSLFIPLTQQAWEVVDIAFFKCINGTLKNHPNLQLFWACANHKLADWVEDVFILGFFIACVRQTSVGLRKRKIAELLFMVLFIAAILYFVNEMFFRKHWPLPRLSPTHVVEDSVRLSKEIPWMSIKDSSSKSFPGDHGTTALLFAAGFACLTRFRLALLGCLYGAFLCMPRLITGAHWLSDILVGSGSIALFFLSWAFCTPLFGKVTREIERFFNLFARKKAVEGAERSV